MKNINSSRLLIAIGAMAIGWYFVAIIYLGFRPRPPANTKGSHGAASLTAPAESSPVTPAVNQTTTTESPGLSDLKQFMALSMTALGGTLATFVGMVIGMSQTSSATPAPAAPAAAGAAAPKTGELTSPQLIAAWAYVFSLVLAMVIWVTWVTKGGQCDESIRHLGQSFLGLVGGALTVMLNVSPRS